MNQALHAHMNNKRKKVFLFCFGLVFGGTGV
jgi:hypothetical protein